MADKDSSQSFEEVDRWGLPRYMTKDGPPIIPRTRKVIAIERKFMRKLKKRYARLKRELYSG